MTDRETETSPFDARIQQAVRDREDRQRKSAIGKLECALRNKLGEIADEYFGPQPIAGAQKPQYIARIDNHYFALDPTNDTHLMYVATVNVLRRYIGRVECLADVAGLIDDAKVGKSWVPPLAPPQAWNRPRNTAAAPSFPENLPGVQWGYEPGSRPNSMRPTVLLSEDQ